MRFRTIILLFAASLFAVYAQAQDLHVRIDLSEPDQLIAAAAAGDSHAIDAAALASFMQTAAAAHLAKTRSLTASDFVRYAGSSEMTTQLSRMQLSLREWHMSSAPRAEQRVSAYLPTEARLSFTVVVVLAPAFDTAEFDTNPEDPRVFVPFTPSMLRARVDTYLGEQVFLLASATQLQEWRASNRRASRRSCMSYESAAEFRRGIALLASAGGPGLHLCGTCPLEQRERWDENLRAFAPDLQSLNALLLATARGKVNAETLHSQLEAIGPVPWQVVGYRMAVIVERYFGLRVLPSMFRDPRQLLSFYNRAAAAQNLTSSQTPLPLWSTELLRLLEVEPPTGFDEHF